MVLITHHSFDTGTAIVTLLQREGINWRKFEHPEKHRSSDTKSCTKINLFACL